MAETSPETEYLQRAELLIEMDRFGEAVPLLTKAQTCNPQNYRVAVSLSICFLNLDDFAESLRCAEEAIAIDPEAEAGYRFKSLCLNNTGRFAESLVYAQRSVGCEPAKVVARENLILMLLRNGRLDEARVEAAELLKIAPGHQISHYAAGHVDLICGRFAEAERAFRRALEIDPEYVKSRHDLGLALWKLSKGDAKIQDEGFEHLIDALKSDPANRIYLRNLRSQASSVYYLSSLWFVPFFLMGWFVTPVVTLIAAALFGSLIALGLANRFRLGRKLAPEVREALKVSKDRAFAGEAAGHIRLTGVTIYKSVWPHALILLAICLIFVFEPDLPAQEYAYPALKILFWIVSLWTLRRALTGLRDAKSTPKA